MWLLSKLASFVQQLIFNSFTTSKSSQPIQTPKAIEKSPDYEADAGIIWFEMF